MLRRPSVPRKPRPPLSPRAAAPFPRAAAPLPRAAAVPVPVPIQAPGLRPAPPPALGTGARAGTGPPILKEGSPNLAIPTVLHPPPEGGSPNVVIC